MCLCDPKEFRAQGKIDDASTDIVPIGVDEKYPFQKADALQPIIGGLGLRGEEQRISRQSDSMIGLIAQEKSQAFLGSRRLISGFRPIRLLEQNMTASSRLNAML